MTPDELKTYREYMRKAKAKQRSSPNHTEKRYAETREAVRDRKRKSRDKLKCKLKTSS